MLLSDFDEQSNLNFTYFYRRALLSGNFKTLTSRDLEKMCQRGIVNVSEGQACLSEYGKTLLQKNGLIKAPEPEPEPELVKELRIIEVKRRNDEIEWLKRSGRKKQRERRYERRANEWNEQKAWKNLSFTFRSLFGNNHFSEPLPKKPSSKHYKKKRLSAEHRLHLSEAGRGRVFSAEHRLKLKWTDERRAKFIAHSRHPHNMKNKISEPRSEEKVRRPRHLSESTREKVSASLRRYHSTHKVPPCSEEHKLAISRKLKGRVFSAETIEKMRLASTHPRPDIAKALRGRHLSEAHRANIGAGVHRFFEAGNKRKKRNAQSSS